MPGPPPPPEQTPMRDELADAWAAYDELMRRAGVLEEIADRLAATAADPVAVEDYRAWKAGDENRSPSPCAGP